MIRTPRKRDGVRRDEWGRDEAQRCSHDVHVTRRLRTARRQGLGVRLQRCPLCQRSQWRHALVLRRHPVAPNLQRPCARMRLRRGLLPITGLQLRGILRRHLHRLRNSRRRRGLLHGRRPDLRNDRCPPEWPRVHLREVQRSGNLRGACGHLLQLLLRGRGPLRRRLPERTGLRRGEQRVLARSARFDGHVSTQLRQRADAGAARSEQHLRYVQLAHRDVRLRDQA
jgi:hypothetical protein